MKFAILALLKIQVENCILPGKSSGLSSSLLIGQYGLYFKSVDILYQLDLINIKEIPLAELTGEVFLAPMCLAASLFIITVATLATFLGVMSCRDLPLDEFPCRTRLTIQIEYCPILHYLFINSSFMT